MDYWLIAFLSGSAFDVLTTYCGLFLLPPKLAVTEGNPLYKDAREHFATQMLGKMVLSILIGLSMSSSGSLFGMRWITYIMWLVVLNNLYVFLSRKISGKRLTTPIGFIYQYVPMPIAFLTFIGVLFGIGYLLAMI